MKKIYFFLLSFLLLAAGTLCAQEKGDTVKYWNHEGMAGINLSQVSLSNWSAGGDGSLAFDLQFLYSLNYKRDRTLWKNRLELAYGLNHTKTDGSRKTNDKIYLSSMYGYELADHWYLSAMLTYQTQFANGYDYARKGSNYISQFMAPGYLSIGPGITWTPKTWITATLSPATWRGTFVLNDRLSDEGSFGVDPGKKILSEFGGNLTVEAKYEFLPNMTVYSRLNLFSNYLEKPQNVDVRWDIQVNMKVNKWVSASLNLNMIYDDDIKILQEDGSKGARLQFKEVLGVGLQARF